MAFNNVSTYKLKKAINKIDVKPDKVNSLIDDLNTNKWNSVGKTKIKQALNDIKTNYNALSKIKSKANQILDSIEQYKDIEKKINTKRNQLKLVKMDIILSDDDRNKKIKEIEKEIENYKTSLRNIENRINNYL